MPATPPDPHPKHSVALSDEADIGSGEKSAGQLETEQIIKQIPALPGSPPGQQARDEAAPGQLQREQSAPRQAADPGAAPDQPKG